MVPHKAGKLHGILFMALFACAASFIGQAQFLKAISISPLIIGIVIGMCYANTLRSHLPAEWVPGIQYSSKRILRLGIILYGFRLTFQDVAAVGLAAVTVDCIVVTVTILGGYWIGKALGMDRDLAMLTSVGSGICGAAAVLGAEATMQTKPYKTAVAVATVVIFGTIAMFLYPIVYRAGVLDLTQQQMGIFAGSTLHEVAHAAGAGIAMGGEGSDIANTTVIVKMIRVMLLVPVLIVLGVWVAQRAKSQESRVKSQESGAGVEGRDGAGANGNSAKGKVAVPWFAFGFLAVIGFNSLDLLPGQAVGWINDFDTFLLTMAMCALGAETSFDKFKKAGPKPFLLAAILFIWLMTGGYLMAKYLVPLLS